MPVLRDSSRRAARASGAEAAAGGMISAAPLVMRSSWSATEGKAVWDSVGMGWLKYRSCVDGGGFAW